MDAKNIGEFLTDLRKKQNLTQKDIANLCNVTTQAVSKWERGESIPDIQILEKLSILYKVTINELIAGEKAELYVDVEKRSNYITLTTSILVFFAYLLNFAKIPITQDLWGFGNQTVINHIVLKGYQVIFDGTGGFFIIIAWLQFIFLFSHLVLHVFIINKVIRKDAKMQNYFKYSSVAVILISLIGVFAGVYYIFPHFIIIAAMIVTLYLMEVKFDFSKVFRKFNFEKEKAPRSNKVISYIMTLLNVGVVSIALMEMIPDIQKHYLYRDLDFTEEQVYGYIAVSAVLLLINLFFFTKMNTKDQKRVFTILSITNIIQAFTLVALNASESFGTSIYIYTVLLLILPIILILKVHKSEV